MSKCFYRNRAEELHKNADVYFVIYNMYIAETRASESHLVITIIKIGYVTGAMATINFS